MPNDRRRNDRPGTITRPIITIAYLNAADVIIASSLTDPRAWWAAAIVGLVSTVCIAAILIAHRR